MSISLIIRPEAEEDIHDAYAWYESQRTGLGIEFINCVEDAFDSILKDPAIHGIIYGNIRRMLAQRFPYGVFFIIENSKIVILAVMHAKRHPRRWQNRF
jgi:toxin ParE1/3/4